MIELTKVITKEVLHTSATKACKTLAMGICDLGTVDAMKDFYEDAVVERVKDTPFLQINEDTYKVLSPLFAGKNIARTVTSLDMTKAYVDHYIMGYLCLMTDTRLTAYIAKTYPLLYKSMIDLSSPLVPSAITKLHLAEGTALLCDLRDGTSTAT